MSSIHAPSASGMNLLLNASTGASPFGRSFGWSHSRLFEPFGSSSPLLPPAPFPPFAFRCTMPGRRQRPASSFVAFRCIVLIVCFEVVIERAFSLAAPIRGSFNRDQHSGTRRQHAFARVGFSLADPRRQLDQKTLQLDAGVTRRTSKIARSADRGLS